MVVLQNIIPCLALIISTSLELFPGKKFLNIVLPNSVFKNFVLKISFIPNGIPKKVLVFFKSILSIWLLMYENLNAALNLYLEFKCLNFLNRIGKIACMGILRAF